MITGVSEPDAILCLGILMCTSVVCERIYCISRAHICPVLPRCCSHGRMSCHCEHTFRCTCSTE